MWGDWSEWSVYEGWWEEGGGLRANDGTTQDLDLRYRQAKLKQVWCFWTAKQLINGLVEPVARARIQ